MNIETDNFNVLKYLYHHTPWLKSHGGFLIETQ